jgi:hypothetical protein
VVDQHFFDVFGLVVLFHPFLSSAWLIRPDKIRAQTTASRIVAMQIQAIAISNSILSPPALIISAPIGVRLAHAQNDEANHGQQQHQVNDHDNFQKSLSVHSHVYPCSSWQ